MSETFEDIGIAVILTGLIAYLGLRDVKALAMIFAVSLPLLHGLRVRYFQEKH